MQLEKGDKVKLDDKDKKIIEQLQINCRQTIAQIAKKTQLPRDVVAYRIERLEKENVVRAHHTMVNPAKLGYPLYTYVFFSTYNIDSDHEDTFVNFLTAQKNIVYVAKNSGEFDFTIGICAKDYLEFDEILRIVRKQFPNIIKEFKTTPIIQEYKFDMMVDLV